MRGGEVRAGFDRLTAQTREASALWHDVKTVRNEFQHVVLALLIHALLRKIAPEYAVL